MEMLEKESLELSVVMPCLNEENAVGYCVDEAMEFMTKNRIRGEVLVVDNGSTDKSAVTAQKHGARVISEKRKGYGRAIRSGIANSRGKVIIIGDCDTTYDFLHLEDMYGYLSKGKCHMVIGNRYAGNMERGAMSWYHRVGVRFLSFCGRVRFHTDVYDFHCGLRGLSRKTAEILTFHTDGMEFATEMIAEAAGNNLCIRQVPVELRRCKYQRESKLRTVKDGLHHLRYILKRERK